MQTEIAFHPCLLCGLGESSVRGLCLMNKTIDKKISFLAADSSSSSPKVVVCLLFVVCDQVRKLLANCLLTAT